MVSESAVSMVGKLHELDLDPAFTPMKLRYYGDTGHGPNAMSWRPSAKPFSAEGGAGKKAKAAAKAITVTQTTALYLETANPVLMPFPSYCSTGASIDQRLRGSSAATPGIICEHRCRTTTDRTLCFINSWYRQSLDRPRDVLKIQSQRAGGPA